MFKVIKSNNSTEMHKSLNYVCKQKNGVIICCDKDKAQGIISQDNSTIYAFKDTDISNDYEVVEVEEIDDIEFMIQHQTDVELAITELYEMMLGGNE